MFLISGISFFKLITGCLNTKSMHLVLFPRIVSIHFQFFPKPAWFRKKSENGIHTIRFLEKLAGYVIHIRQAVSVS